MGLQWLMTVLELCSWHRDLHLLLEHSGPCIYGKCLYIRVSLRSIYIRVFLYQKKTLCLMMLYFGERGCLVVDLDSGMSVCLAVYILVWFICARYRNRPYWRVSVWNTRVSRQYNIGQHVFGLFTIVTWLNHMVEHNFGASGIFVTDAKKATFQNFLI